MQFKWRKFYSKRFDRVLLAAPLVLALGLFLIVSLEEVFGAIYVQPTGQGGSVSPSSLGGGTFYYYIGLQDNGNIFNFDSLDIEKQIKDQTGVTTDMVEFFVRSDVPFTTIGNERAVVTFFAMPDPGATPRPVPIAAVNGVRCDNGGACQAKNQLNPTLDPKREYYYAAYYPSARATIKVGFYVRDVCEDAKNASGAMPLGCKQDGSGTHQDVSAGTPLQMAFMFQVSKVPNPLPSTVPTGTPVDKMTVQVNLSMQSDSAVFNCPSASSLSEAYQPGDKSIMFYPSPPAVGSLFSLTKSSSTQADAASIFVVGNKRTAPDLSEQYATLNSIVKSVSVTQPTLIDGFENSTSAGANANDYHLSFLIQDQTGTLIVPSSSCILEPVYASAVEGFLGSSKCFIATAAFGAEDARTVLLFRKLRDEVLLDTRLGFAFVEWYYSWSENAADWLLERPVLRIPLLYAMMPLELMAWILLYPVGFLVWFGVSVLVLFYGVRVLQRQATARSVG